MVNTRFSKIEGPTYALIPAYGRWSLNDLLPIPYKCALNVDGLRLCAAQTHFKQYWIFEYDVTEDGDHKETLTTGRFVEFGEIADLQSIRQRVCAWLSRRRFELRNAVEKIRCRQSRRAMVTA